jgi:hypothetical protein
MNFVWIYEYPYSAFRKSGLFNELKYSILAVKKFYNRSKCFVLASAESIKEIEGQKMNLEATVIECPPRVETHKTNHPDHFDILNKFNVMIADDRINDEFILMYDDLFLLHPMTKKDFKNYARCEIQNVNDYYAKRAGSGIYKMMWKSTYDYLSLECLRSGRTLYDWETHLPRLMTKSGLSEVIDKYGSKYIPMLMTSFYSYEFGGETVLMDETTQSDLYTINPYHTNLDHEFSKSFMNLGDDAITLDLIQRFKELVK